MVIFVMSEYQLYQFQAIDAPLTQYQKQYLHDLSSRAQVTSYSAQYEYHYSDFPAELSEVLLQGFDLALYQANWGAIQLLIRLPAALVNVAKLRAFCIDDLIGVQQQQDSIVLEISFHDEDSGRWIEDKEELAEIADIRAMLLRGDYRPLYLAWLKAALWLWQSDSVASSMPIPEGFNHLDPSLQALVNLLELDQDLIAAVAEYSPKPLAQRELKPLSSLSATESIAWLQRLLDAEPLLAEKLTQHLTPNGDEVATATTVVSVSRLLEQAKQAASRRLAAAAAVKQQQRLAYLNSLMPKQTQLWRTVVALIDKKQTKAYEQAVAILIDLFELAKIQNQTAEFKVKTNDLLARYANRSALKAKFKAAQLL
jgi:hypothetical protein